MKQTVTDAGDYRRGRVGRVAMDSLTFDNDCVPSLKSLLYAPPRKDKVPNSKIFERKAIKQVFSTSSFQCDRQITNEIGLRQ